MDIIVALWPAWVSQWRSGQHTHGYLSDAGASTHMGRNASALIHARECLLGQDLLLCVLSVLRVLSARAVCAECALHVVWRPFCAECALYLLSVRTVR